MINLYEGLKTFPSLSKQLDCRGLLFTNYECPQPNSQERFFVECHFIAYVLSGRRIFHKHHASWELKEGACVFVKKGAHIAEKPRDEEWCVMVFFMPDNFLAQVINENKRSLPLTDLPQVNSDYVLPLDVNDLSRSFFLSMPPYFSQVPPPPENLLELKFKELLLSLFTNKANRHLLAYLNHICSANSESIVEVMENNYTFNLTVAEYAKLTCKSIPTFKREFKRVFKETPGKWILKRRLALAANLLENTSLSIGEIVFECGFENQTHFSRVFKDKMGMQPSQFRARVRSEMDNVSVVKIS
jgi:AraC family transcriptional regulator, exoenzyme S synthesis regulatory protein ExsA